MNSPSIKLLLTGPPGCGKTTVMATVAAKGGGLIGQVRARPDIEIVAVTAENRDCLPNELVRRIQT
jgi:nucleoside-triphosphatase THEP1